MKSSSSGALSRPAQRSGGRQPAPSNFGETLTDGGTTRPTTHDTSITTRKMTISYPDASSQLMLAGFLSLPRALAPVPHATCGAARLRKQTLTRGSFLAID